MKQSVRFWLLAGTSTLLAGVANAQSAPASPDAMPAAAAPATTPTSATPSAAAASPTADTPTPAAPIGTPPGASADTASSASAEIVVTGSRVIKNGNNSPTPVTVIPTQQLLTVQPTTVVDAVNLAPALQGSQSLSSSPGGGQRNGAAAYLNLRALGDLRTLVLMDGQRVVPTINQNEANVDAFVIPQLLIKRVDVVTGGVSAVYGSDAVSGVVNFITDKDFNGLKVTGSGGVSNYGDDVERDIGLAYGRKFADGRGHIEVSYEYRKDPGISSQDDRPFFEQSLGGAGLGTAASPYYNVTNTRISNTSFGGLITSGPLAGYQFAQNGVLSKFNHGTPTGTANVESGGDGGWYNYGSIKSGLEFHQAFLRGDYDVTDNIHGYVELGGTFNHTHNYYRSPLESVTIGNNNPFALAVPQLAAAAALNPTGSFAFSRLIDIPAEAEQQTNTYMLHSGLDGELDKYKWNLSFSRSMSVIKAQNDANVDQEKFLAASNAVVNPANGNIVCHAALTNANYANCVPINLFGPTAQSADALKYILDETYNKNSTTLTEVDGSFTGAPFDTWAGPVNMALSGEWRRLNWSIKSNASPSDPVDCNGIQFSCTSTTTRYLQNVQGGLAGVTQDVEEAAYEVDVPLAKDARFAQSLDLNAAARYTHYSTSGSVETWKVGLVWKPTTELTLRGTISRDIRAPNVFELFSPTTIAPTTISDPLTGTANRVGVATISNPNLTPEKARSITGGFIWTPHFLPGFSFSADAYYIKINNAITLLSGNSSSVLNQCAADGGTSPICAELIQRPLGGTNTTAANFPTLLYQEYLNIASFNTVGVDFESNYSTKIFDRGFNIRALVSYQPRLLFNQGPSGTIELAGVATGVNLFPAAPALKFTIIAQYALTDRFNITVLERGRSALKAVGVVDGQADKVFLNGKDHDPATAYTNLTLSYDVGPSHRDQVYVNVQNLFNKAPEVYYAGADSSPGVGLGGFFPPNGDDVVGRYFTVGFRAQF